MGSSRVAPTGAAIGVPSAPNACPIVKPSSSTTGGRRPCARFWSTLPVETTSNCGALSDGWASQAFRSGEQDLFCALLGVDDARVRHSSGSLRLDPLTPRAEVALCGYQVWDASGQGGPCCTVRTRYTAEGMR